MLHKIGEVKLPTATPMAFDGWWLQNGNDERVNARHLNGTRTNVLDIDRKVFFPFWGKDQPGPEYWRSRYGIATRPGDRLH